MPEVSWRPNSKKQETFLGLPDSIFEGLYGGAAGGGKTEVLLMLPIFRRFHEHPRFRGIIFRRSFPQIEESLLPRSRELGYEYLADYNDTKHVWKFRSGATIRFAFMERKEDAYKHDTAQYHYIGWEELTEYEEFCYVYMTHRCRTVIPELPAIIRGAATPGNIGNTWVRDRFVVPAREGFTVLKETLPNNAVIKRIFIPARITDNKDLMRNDPQYINRLHLLPEAEKKAKIYGDWWAFAGQVFPEFRSLKYPDEPENALHVIEEFDIPNFWPKLIAIDWGYDHKTVVLWGAIDPAGRLYIYRQYVARKTNISTWASDIARLSQFDENIVAKIIDPSAKRKDGLEKSIFEQVVESTGWEDLEVANNDRVSGKLLVHEYLRWTQKPASYIPSEGYSEDKAQYILRNFGLEAYKEYKLMFDPAPIESNLPKLQIFKSCSEIIDTLPLCKYSETTSNEPTKVEDVQKFNGDDSYDTLRYLLKAVERYTKEVKEEYEKRQRIQRVVAEYETTGNWTGYYRKMEKLEAKDRINLPSPVRIYHGTGFSGRVHRLPS